MVRWERVVGLRNCSESGTSYVTFKLLFSVIKLRQFEYIFKKDDEEEEQQQQQEQEEED